MPHLVLLPNPEAVMCTPLFELPYTPYLLPLFVHTEPTTSVQRLPFSSDTDGGLGSKEYLLSENPGYCKIPQCYKIMLVALIMQVVYRIAIFRLSTTKMGTVCGWGLIKDFATLF